MGCLVSVFVFEQLLQLGRHEGHAARCPLHALVQVVQLRVLFLELGVDGAAHAVQPVHGVTQVRELHVLLPHDRLRLVLLVAHEARVFALDGGGLDVLGAVLIVLHLAPHGGALHAALHLRDLLQHLLHEALALSQFGVRDVFELLSVAISLMR